jgi:hypothetical protein
LKARCGGWICPAIGSDFGIRALASASDWLERHLSPYIWSQRERPAPAKRIFERLRDEYGYTGGITIVKDYVHERRLREMFVPLRHDPGHAQADFGEAFAVIGGVEQKIHFFAMDLPHGDGCLVQAYPGESSQRRDFAAAHDRNRSPVAPHHNSARTSRAPGTG